LEHFWKNGDYYTEAVTRNNEKICDLDIMDSLYINKYQYTTAAHKPANLEAGEGRSKVVHDWVRRQASCS